MAKVAKLTDEGRMRPAGLARSRRGPMRTPAIYSYERALRPSSTTSRGALPGRRGRLGRLGATPASYRQQVTHWVTSAKQAATRERRLATLIEDCGRAGQLKPMTWDGNPMTADRARRWRTRSSGLRGLELGDAFEPRAAQAIVAAGLHRLVVPERRAGSGRGWWRRPRC